MTPRKLKDTTVRLFLNELVYEKLTELVIVPGHAIYVGNHSSETQSPAAWTGTFPGYLKADEIRLYAEHVANGVRLANERPRALLIFSGGQTREEAGPISEAFGYWRLADQSAWFGNSIVRQRSATEEFARDSFENVLFSLYRFHQCTNSWPDSVLVSGFSFKQQRFVEHARLINADLRRFGIERKFKFQYQGVNEPPYYVLEGQGGSSEGEEKTRRQFVDPNDPDLQEKRRERDPFMRGNPYIPLRDPRTSYSC